LWQSSSITGFGRLEDWKMGDYLSQPSNLPA
jgi:hypothetical protein